MGMGTGAWAWAWAWAWTWAHAHAQAHAHAHAQAQAHHLVGPARAAVAGELVDQLTLWRADLQKLVHAASGVHAFALQRAEDTRAGEELTRRQRVHRRPQAAFALGNARPVAEATNYSSIGRRWVAAEHVDEQRVHRSSPLRTEESSVIDRLLLGRICSARNVVVVAVVVIGDLRPWPRLWPGSVDGAGPLKEASRRAFGLPNEECLVECLHAFQPVKALQQARGPALTGL